VTLQAAVAITDYDVVMMDDDDDDDHD